MGYVFLRLSNRSAMSGRALYERAPPGADTTLPLTAFMLRVLGIHCCLYPETSLMPMRFGWVCLGSEDL